MMTSVAKDAFIGSDLQVWVGDFQEKDIDGVVETSHRFSIATAGLLHSRGNADMDTTVLKSKTTLLN